MTAFALTFVSASKKIAFRKIKAVSAPKPVKRTNSPPTECSSTWSVAEDSACPEWAIAGKSKNSVVKNNPTRFSKQSPVY